MKKLFAVIIGIVTIFGSCSIEKQKNSELKKLEWLIGSWKNVSEERELYEIWTKVNDTLFTGKSFMLIYEDTVFTETILIQSIGNDIFYIPAVSDQNEGKAIPFKLISGLEKEFIFENKEHDFPQRIVYTNPQTDSLYAYVDGEENEQYHKSEFFLKRCEEK